MADEATKDVLKNEEETKKKVGKRGVRRVVNRAFLILLIIVLIMAAGGGIWFYFTYGRQLLACREAAGHYVAAATDETFRASQTTLCYYADGTLMSTLKGEKDVYYLDYESIPKSAINAMIATEDRKFFSHSGYDIYAIARAARAYIINEGEIHQGGSTITQQLARAIFLTNEVTIERKVTEIFIAAELEKRYSKEKILEFYMNNIYFANGHYGIQAAAKAYFGISAGELTISQAAFLCTIPNNPTRYDPYTSFAETMLRRDSVLLQMYENEKLTAEEYNEAVAEEITLVTGSENDRNYAETYTYYCAVRALMRRDGFIFRNSFADEEDESLYREYYAREYSRLQHSLYTRGYRIYTSIDKTKQKLLQESIDNELAGYTEVNDEGIYCLQASAACIDNDTGRVAAIIGGREQEYFGYTLNRAYQSPRQPGSSIKPLIVYTPCFENDYYPDTIVLDERFEGGPRNSSDVYSGEVELRQAISVSKNTVAWKLFDVLTPGKGLSYLLKQGFESIVKTDYVPAAALGGLTYGVTAVEMASAYAAIENEGIFRSPTCINMITDAEGARLIDNVGISAMSVADEEQVYQKQAALMMTDCLQTVMESGTGRKLALSGMSSAGKTGTTNDQKDGWFIGYTRYYTTGVWVGYDMPRAMEELMGNTYPGYIWHSYMEKLHEGLADRSFELWVDNRSPKTEQEESTDESEEAEQENELTQETVEEPETEEPETEETETEEKDAESDGDMEPDVTDEADTVDDIIWVTPGGDDDIIWVTPTPQQEEP